MQEKKGCQRTEAPPQLRYVARSIMKKCVALNFAPLPNTGVFLDLYKGPYSRLIIDCAAIEVDEIV